LTFILDTFFKKSVFDDFTEEILIQGLTWLFSAAAADVVVFFFVVVVVTIFSCIAVVQLKPDVATDIVVVDTFKCCTAYNTVWKTDLAICLHNQHFSVVVDVKRFQPCCSQFHQHFTSSFCADILMPKNYKPNFNSRIAVQNTF